MEVFLEIILNANKCCSYFDLMFLLTNVSNRKCNMSPFVIMRWLSNQRSYMTNSCFEKRLKITIYDT